MQLLVRTIVLAVCLLANGATAEVASSAVETGASTSASVSNTKLRGSHSRVRARGLKKDKGGKKKDKNDKDSSDDGTDRFEDGGAGTIIVTPANPNRVEVAPGVWVTKADPTPVPVTPPPTFPPPTTAAPVSSSPTTLSPVTPAPTAKQTAKPSSVAPPTPKPTATAVTTPAPTAALPEGDRTDPEIGGSGGAVVIPANPRRWPFDTCSNRPNQDYWEPLAYPEYAQSTRCFFSEGCTETPFSCCLADKCLCGVYKLKSEECVPFINEEEDVVDRNDSGGTGGTIDIGTTDLTPKTGDDETIIDNQFCERPENQEFWDTSKYPELANKFTCTSNTQCRFLPRSCCLVSSCMCGEPSAAGDCVSAN